jgi:hypothetical protein
MRNIFTKTIVGGLFVFSYLAVAMAPVMCIAGLNYALASGDCWPNMAEAWLAGYGIPFPGFAMMGAYVAVVFFPSIRFATWLAFEVASPRLKQGVNG